MKPRSSLIMFTLLLSLPLALTAMEPAEQERIDAIEKNIDKGNKLITSYQQFINALQKQPEKNKKQIEELQTIIDDAQRAVTLLTKEVRMSKDAYTENKK